MSGPTLCGFLGFAFASSFLLRSGHGGSGLGGSELRSVKPWFIRYAKTETLSQVWAPNGLRELSCHPTYSSLSPSLGPLCLTQMSSAKTACPGCGREFAPGGFTNHL